jgi:hypothetical protein
MWNDKWQRNSEVLKEKPDTLFIITATGTTPEL